VSEATIGAGPEGAGRLTREPAHLDGHDTFAEYVAAKLKIFANQGNDDVAVAPLDLGVADLGGCARRVPFGSAGAELSDRAGYLWWDEEPLLDVTEISLPGAHNRANAMAAAAACLARGIDRDAVAAGLRTFRGSPTAWS
jgi:UDP-N-acetylmuramoylalanine--D-glutamate ligase